MTDVKDYSDSFEEIRKNIGFFYKPVQMAGGHTFDHADTLKRINLYHASKYEKGCYDSQGFYKYFYNIVKPSCDVATKFIDLDVKDFIFVSETPEQDYKIWIMQRDFRYWTKTSGFGELLNTIAFDYPKYGSIVLKSDKTNEWNKVNLENLRFDPSTSSLEESSFVYEVHMMTVREMHDMKWDKEIIDQLVTRNSDSYHFTVYECYDYLPDGAKKWTRKFVTDFSKRRAKDGPLVETPESELNDRNSYVSGLVLHEDEVAELPYRELHWERTPGRWLGVGFTEYLFDNQIRRNEIINIKAKNMYFSSLKVFQTSDETIGKNLLSSVENGQILKTASPITPVVTEERNLPAFAEEEQQWDMNTERKTFTFDIARGGNLPSQTPLGVAQLSAGMVSSYFEIKREQFGLFMRQLVLNDILPSFKKENRKKHILRFMSSDKEITKIRKAVTDHTINKSILDYASKTGLLPSKMSVELMRYKMQEFVMKKEDVALEIPDSFYDDVEATVDVQVTGEQFDSGARMQTLNTALQILGSNPTIVENPVTRSIFLKMLELAGVSSLDIDSLNADSQALQQDVPMMQQQQPQMAR